MSHRASDSKDAEHEAVVIVRKSSWESVTDNEEFVGVFSLVEAFPQYLMTAMLTGAVAVAW